MFDYSPPTVSLSKNNQNQNPGMRSNFSPFYRLGKLRLREFDLAKFLRAAKI
jgi:hypothetical protein